MVKIGISHGDLAGISSEILVKSVKKLPKAIYIIYGSSKAIQKAQTLLNEKFDLIQINKPEEAKKEGFYIIDLFDEDIQFGKPSVKSGKASVLFLQNAVRDILDKKLNALVTMPISKEWIMKAGFKYAGHTDYLADVSNIKEYAMILFCNKLKVGLITTHIPLKDVPKNISKEKIISKIRLINEELKQKFCIKNPKIAVLGLNPHASDNSNIGDEEEKIIIPAINQLKNEGINLIGPLSPDTAFINRKDFDIYIAMYHDQGLIPLKMLCFRKAVNMTFGLPFIRTSPDHGTGYDIAGKGIADESSFLYAVKIAKRLINKSC
ncbi:4-hydroxythreonine-4-phosphate dehydrogenase PdxA [Venenivibrio stagnispumantis]|uniref:4-hydroxythreonine-4-phosphate dehydrogenase n=1 Tax=Venenivibrio stagnispumantis TaxID=407998 RepID=A0AA45WN23_9AQUI|nr:4-hydroxythreonine-4-phosphate dehydrogenase PdxA [Venenivibrio stagnispumantis]MCW4573588.1 4-hydroxythreonine-4-phosphate dehydrogenase PdxA [Venenivibrio stagnispumantis]SMP16790.1 4-hydroxythreonine-4-phosphate dehydrogenase [Venenivibrio stagnispumantis]